MQSISIETGNHTVRGVETSGVGPTLVFIHGNSGNAALFRGLIARLTERLPRVVALDLPGHGESEHAEDPRASYSIPAMASVMAKALESLKSDRLVLVGHSLGGHVISAALAEHLALDGLMLVSAPPLSPWNLQSVFKPDPTGGALFQGSLSQDAVERFANALIEPSPLPSHVLSMIESSIKRVDVRFRGALGESIAAGELANEERLVAEFVAPTALVYGTEDRFLDTACFERFVLRNPWRTGRFPFRGSGHSPHLHFPDAMAELVADFAEDCFARR